MNFWTFSFTFLCFVLVRLSVSNLVIVFNFTTLYLTQCQTFQQCRRIVVNAFAFCIFFLLINLFLNKWRSGPCHWQLLNGQVVSAQCFVSLYLCTQHFVMQGEKGLKNGLSRVRLTCKKKTSKPWVGPFLYGAKNLSLGQVNKFLLVLPCLIKTLSMAIPDCTKLLNPFGFRF